MSKNESFDSQAWGKKLDAHETTDSLLSLADTLSHTPSVNYNMPSEAKHQLRKQLQQQLAQEKRPFFSPRTVTPALATTMVLLIAIFALNWQSRNSDAPETVVLPNPEVLVLSPVAEPAPVNEAGSEPTSTSLPTAVAVIMKSATPLSTAVSPTPPHVANNTVLDPVQEPPPFTAEPVATANFTPISSSVPTLPLPTPTATPMATMSPISPPSSPVAGLPTSSPAPTNSPAGLATGGEADPPAVAVVPPIVESEATDAANNTNPMMPLPDPMHPWPPEPYPSPEDTFFEAYGVNPFISTEQDTLSTFALDVDSGSYTIMRRHLTQGLVPPPASVRVEEYVNYFETDYEGPETGAFNILLEGAPAPYGSEQNHYLVRVGVQGYDVPPSERPDALLIFVIDTSGSMGRDNRLGLVKQSLRLLIDELRFTDRIGLVTYGATVEVVLEPTSVDSRQTILQAIDSLQPTGLTNMEDGLRTAYDLASFHRQFGQINRIILASDGVANVGQTTAEALISSYAQDGVSLSTFGFGLDNYNDMLMEQLANQGDGTYAYIDTLAEAERLFVNDLTGTLFTIAKDAKTQVAFNPAAVLAYRLIGYENRDIADEDFRNDSVDAGEIGAGHSATALYEIKLVDDVAAETTLFTASIRYTEPQTEIVREVSREFKQSALASSFVTASPRFQLTAVVAEFAEILRHSPMAVGSSLFGLTEDAQRIAWLLPTDNDVQEFVWLVERATLLNAE